ncbi:MAG TPA: glycine zipper family protein [Acetobacteraceae bacterium]|nr:glycine zipper family protein [Acetobacteraceae bacterium]
MMKPIAALTVTALLLTGCANMSPGEQRALSGTAIGTAGGAVIGAMAGNAAVGAGIGAAAGLAGGLLVNGWKNAEAKSYQEGYSAGQQSR